MNAADATIKAITEIVTRTGCSVEAATDYFFDTIAAERPELLTKVGIAAGLVEVR
jgi:hypothetical protein